MAEDLKEILGRRLRAAIRRGDREESAALLEHLRREDPLSVVTRGLELEYLLLCGRLDEAEPLATQLIELFPRSARVWYLAGRAAYRRKEYPRAEERFRESQNLYPHPGTLREIGRTLTQLGRLDEAEEVLVPLAGSSRRVHLDLAWLYERKGDDERALRSVEKHLESFPDDAFARAQLLRLQARSLGAEELHEEVRDLREHGEEVPEEILPEFVESLLKSGRGAEARELIARRSARIKPPAATRTAWVCYRLEAHDLAFDLFAGTFELNRSNPKFLSAFEAAARRSGRVGEILRLYGKHVREDPRFYGRIRRLRAEGGR